MILSAVGYFCFCSQVADMAAMLRARYRWMVTGTPIGAGILRDLYGLMRALQHDPFQDLKLWQTCIEHPCTQGRTAFPHGHASGVAPAIKRAVLPACVLCYLG